MDNGYWSTNYLDDFGSAEKASQAWNSFNLMGRILTSIGVDEAIEKAVPPTTRMEFLGNTVDTIKMTLEVSKNRRVELCNLLQQWCNRDMFTLKQLQTLIDKLSFVTNCIRAGCVFINRLLTVLRRMPKRGAIPMEQEILLDIKWWMHYLPRFDGVSILWLQECLEIDKWLSSDASLTGGGGVHDKQYFHVKFEQDILVEAQHIAQREMITIMIAIKLWSNELAGKVVKFSTDNQWCMHTINSGASRDPYMLKCLREITWVCAENQILLKAVYIESKANKIPDLLSRWYNGTGARHEFKRCTDNTWKRRSISKQLTTFSNFY